MYSQPVVGPQRRTNGYATASLILGLTSIPFGWCLLFIPSVLAVVFGHLALRQIRSTHQEGRGAAITGLVAGYSVPVLGLIGVAMMLITNP
jgi:hypothetical protein